MFLPTFFIFFKLISLNPDPIDYFSPWIFLFLTHVFSFFFFNFYFFQASQFILSFLFSLNLFIHAQVFSFIYFTSFLSNLPIYSLFLLFFKSTFITPNPCLFFILFNLSSLNPCHFSIPFFFYLKVEFKRNKHDCVIDGSRCRSRGTLA